MATRDTVEQFIRELCGTGKQASVILSGACLAAAQEAPLSVQQYVIRALLAMSDTAVREVQWILDSLDQRVVTQEAITALPDHRTHQAMLFLMGRTEDIVIRAVEEEGHKFIEGPQIGTAHGLFALASILTTKTPEAAGAARGLDVHARERGYDGLAPFAVAQVEARLRATRAAPTEPWRVEAGAQGDEETPAVFLTGQLAAWTLISWVAGGEAKAQLMEYWPMWNLIVGLSEKDATKAHPFLEGLWKVSVPRIHVKAGREVVGVPSAGGAMGWEEAKENIKQVIALKIADGSQ